MAGSNLQKAVDDFGLAISLAFAPIGKAIEGVVRAFADAFNRPDNLRALIMLAEAELQGTARWHFIKRHKLKQFIAEMERKLREREARDAMGKHMAIGVDLGFGKDVGIQTSPLDTRNQDGKVSVDPAGERYVR